MKKKLCLITGASAGIGRAYAYLFAERGYDLAIVARREDRLQELQKEISEKYNASSLIIVADLHNIDAPQYILDKIAENGLVVDALVNNAGYGLPGTFLTTEWNAQKDFLQIMLNAPTELCHKVLPGMKERGFGRIINVASLAGHLPGAVGHTLYAAVKSYLIKMSQSVNFECEGTGINVTALCPGFTYSEFHDVNGTRDLVSNMPSYMWLDADKVADIGFDAVEQNKPVCVTGTVNKIIAALGKVLPDALLFGLIKQNSNKFRKI